MLHPLFPSARDPRLGKKENDTDETTHNSSKHYLAVNNIPHGYRKPTSLPLNNPRLSKMGRRSSPDLRYVSQDLFQQRHHSSIAHRLKLIYMIIAISKYIVLFLNRYLTYRDEKLHNNANSTGWVIFFYVCIRSNCILFYFIYFLFTF